jgi:hypothetical protein
MQGCELLSESVVIHNPVYWRNVIIRGSIYGAGCLLGAALILTEGTGMSITGLAVVALLFIAVFYLFVGHPEIVRRPKRIEIVETGVLLHRRVLPGSKMVRWDDILSVTVYLGDPSEIDPEYYREAILLLKNKSYYNINRPSALAIREAHLAKFGSYPLRGRPGKLGP